MIALRFGILLFQIWLADQLDWKPVTVPPILSLTALIVTRFVILWRRAPR